MELDHINIRAPQALLQQEKDFFCQLFEVTEGFRPNFSKPGYWLYSGENALIHLTQSDEHREKGTKNHLDHIAFRMTNLQDFIKRLENMSVTFRTAKVPELQLTQLFFTSHSGVSLEASFRDD